jgi:tRNA1(Val) A37 N6-methylase TrmN6
MTKLQSFNYKNTEIFYSNDHTGGGLTFGKDYIKLLKLYYTHRKFNHCLDWCAGPGFIGFYIYLNKLCTKLSLFEKNKLDIDFINSDDIATIDEHLKFDLIVGNPPHFCIPIFQNKFISKRLTVDLNFDVHKNFFKNIKKNLTRDGVIILQESVFGSSPEIFEEDLNNSDLKITNVYDGLKKSTNHYQTYFIEITHK